MRRPALRRSHSGKSSGVTGTARLDRRTRALTRRLHSGDVAVIDHVDLDRVSAEGLVGGGVAAVVNASPSISGRYPNLGPEVLADAGIPLLDDVGTEVFAQLNDGDPVRLEGEVLYQGDRPIAEGRAHDPASVSAAMTAARGGLAAQLTALAADTAAHLRQDSGLLLEGTGLPEIRTVMRGRHVLVVGPGREAAEQLRALRGYLREHRPVLVGVDEGADALVAARHTPDLVVGDLTVIGDAALLAAAERVSVGTADAREAQRVRLDRLHLSAVPFAGSRTGEEVAALLADLGGARLVVAAGEPTSLVELLDRGRTDAAGRFLVRLRLGARLVDARAAAQLTRTRRRDWLLILLLLLAGLVAVLVAVAATPVGQEWLDAAGAWLADLVSSP